MTQHVGWGGGDAPSAHVSFLLPILCRPLILFSEYEEEQTSDAEADNDSGSADSERVRSGGGNQRKGSVRIGRDVRELAETSAERALNTLFAKDDGATKKGANSNSRTTNSAANKRKAAGAGGGTGREVEQEVNEKSELQMSRAMQLWDYWLARRAAANGNDGNGPMDEQRQCLERMSVEQLSEALAAFVSDIRQPDGSRFTPDALYDLCLGTPVVQLFLVQLIMYG